MIEPPVFKLVLPESGDKVAIPYQSVIPAKAGIQRNKKLDSASSAE
jgi:hypothetical protein